MSTKEVALHGTYRCPVCGHRDAVEVMAGGPARRITCSYCVSLLEVSARDRDAVNLSVQLAEAPVAG
jgi:hypothetical protein